MTKLKFFSLIVLFSMILFSSNACTKENNDKEQKISASDKNEGYIFAANNSGNPKVSYIESFGKAQKGKAVDFSWVENGKTISFSKFTKGKVVLLNFWGTWCGPCRMEIPDLIALDKELSSKDFALIGISLEKGRTLEQNMNTVKGFIKAKNISYRSLIPKDTRAFTNVYGGIQGIPTTFIIDRKGNIVETFVGPRSKAVFLKSIKRAMNS
ncbi:TlpA family protein disulfide reductase [Bacteroidota bacterium]